MSARIQQMNGDTVLEITETTTVKTRLSENELLARKERLVESIAKLQRVLTETDALLSQIHEQKERR